MKVLDFIVCEDIRQELGDKLSLMGVYTDSMVINFRQEEKWPFVTRLGFFIKLDPEGAPFYPDCNFQVSRNGEIKSGIPIHLVKREQNKILAIVLNVAPFAISSPGILNFSLEFFGSGLEPLSVELPAFEVKTSLIKPQLPVE